MNDIVELRLRRDDDTKFIIPSFLKGVYYGNEFYRNIPKDAFMASYKLVADALLNRCTVIIACLKDDQDVILGYSIVSPDGLTAHWCFVKKAWRGRGIGKMLIPSKLAAITHFTQIDMGKPTQEAADKAIKRITRRFDGCIFNPFAL